MFRAETTCGKLSSAILIFTTVLSACATGPIGPTYTAAAPSTAAEQRMRQESQIFNASSLEACMLIGGGVALLTWLITQKDRSERALIGALAGCGVGVGVNYYVQTRRSQYADDEMRLQAMISDVRADNERLNRLIHTSREVIAADLRKIADIEQAYRHKQLSLTEAQNQMRAVDDNRAYLEQTLANLRQREQRWHQIAQQERYQNQSTSMTVLDREISKLQSQIASLERELQILINRRIVSPIA